MNKAKAEFRIKIFQDIKALAAIPGNLVLAWCRHESDWGGLTVKGNLSTYDEYTYELNRLVKEIQEKLLSEAGAQFTPRGLYRSLLDFKDKCVEFLKWNQGISVGESQFDPDDINIWQHLESQLRYRFKCDVENLQIECNNIVQKVFIYENEREESDESFFGSIDAGSGLNQA